MTNQLFQDVLDGRIPMPRRRARTGFYFLPGLAGPAAPTVAELNAGIDLTNVTIGFNLAPKAAAREEEREARNRAIAEAAAAAGETFADMEAALIAMGAAAQRAAQAAQAAYVIPPPKPWGGNVATQKRPRKL